MLQVGQEWIEFQGRQWLDGFFKMKEQAAIPGTPSTDFIHFYSRDKAGVAELFYKNDAGVERDLSNVALIHAQIHAIDGADHTGFPLGVTKGGTGTITQFTPGSVIFAGASGVYSQNNPKLFWDNTNSDLLIGSNSNPWPPVVGRGLSIVKEAPQVAEVSLFAFAPIDLSIVFRGLHARGTIALPTQSLANDGMIMLLNPRDNVGFFGSVADIRLLCSETQTTIAHGAEIRFSTTALGSLTLLERFRIGPSGQWGIGGANFGTAGQYERSGGALAAPSWATIALSELSPRDHATLTVIGANDHHTESHKARHVVGGADPFVGGDLLDATARVTVRKNTGVDVGARRRLNLIEGANITLTVVDDVAGEEVDVTVAAAGGGGSANIKQVELDFGVAHNIKEGAFTVVDADVLAGSQIIMLQALDAPTGKVEDENEMDSFNCKCRPDPAGGQFKAYIESQYGSVTDKFKFNYLVG